MAGWHRAQRKHIAFTAKNTSGTQYRVPAPGYCRHIAFRESEVGSKRRHTARERSTPSPTPTPPVSRTPASLAATFITMALHHSGKKEILSFYELERRNVFDQNKALLAVRLEAMEREIQQLTMGYQPIEKTTYARIQSKKIKLSAEEQEEQRNWHHVEPPSGALDDALAQLPLHKRPTSNKRKKKGKGQGNTMPSNAVKSGSKTQQHRLQHHHQQQRRRLRRSQSEPVTSMPTTPLRTISKATPDFRTFRRGQLQLNDHRKRRCVPLGGGGPRFPRPVLSGVMNGPNERTYNVKGFFGLHPKGEMVETFAWDEVRDADIIKGGAWNLRMLRYANERKASMAARSAAQKVKQSRRLKQQAKDELKIADQTDRRQSLRPRNWFVRNLEAPETMVFQYTRGGQIRCAVPPPTSLPRPQSSKSGHHLKTSILDAKAQTLTT
jgi:hypothetical protein